MFSAFALLSVTDDRIGMRPPKAYTYFVYLLAQSDRNKEQTRKRGTSQNGEYPHPTVQYFLYSYELFLATSLCGGSPNCLLYSRLNWEALS